MDANLAEELLNQLGSSLENLETQHAALLQFLKDSGVVTDEQLAPYLAQAGKASGVRWRAARVRLDRLLSTEREKEEQVIEKQIAEQQKQGPPNEKQKEEPLAPKQQDQKEQNQKDAPQAPLQSQSKGQGNEAASKSDQNTGADTGKAEPQHEIAAPNGSEAKSVTKKDSGKDSGKDTGQQRESAAKPVPASPETPVTKSK